MTMTRNDSVWNTRFLLSGVSAVSEVTWTIARCWKWWTFDTSFANQYKFNYGSRTKNFDNRCELCVVESNGFCQYFKRFWAAKLSGQICWQIILLNFIITCIFSVLTFRYTPVCDWIYIIKILKEYLFYDIFCTENHFRWEKQACIHNYDNIKSQFGLVIDLPI